MVIKAMLRIKRRMRHGDERLRVVREGLTEEVTSLRGEHGQEPALRKGEWGMGMSTQITW